MTDIRYFLGMYLLSLDWGTEAWDSWGLAAFPADKVKP